MTRSDRRLGAFACCFIFPFVALAVTARSTIAQAPVSEVSKPRVTELVVGEKLESRFTDEEAHEYRIVLGSGEFMHLVVDQEDRDTSLLIKVLGPDGETLEEISESFSPKLFVWLIAPVSGQYRVVLSPQNSHSLETTCGIVLDELRAPTPADRNRADGSQALREALRLVKVDSAETRPQAIQEFQRAVSLFHDASDRTGEAYALGVFGVSFWSEARFETDLGHLNQAALLWHSLGELRLEAYTLEGVAAFEDASGKLEEELASLNQELSLYRAMGDRLGEARVLGAIGAVYGDEGLGEFQSSLKYLEEARSIFRAAGRWHDEYSTLVDLGATHEVLGDYQQAIQVYDQALSLAHSENSRRAEADILQLIGVTHSALGENEKALLYLNQSLAIWHELGEPMGEAFVLRRLARFYIDQHDYERAIELLNQVQHTEQTRDHMGRAGTLHLLGIVYHRQGRKEQALEMLNQALALWPFKKDRQARSILDEIGAAHEDSEDWQGALTVFNEVLSNARAASDSIWESSALAAIGRNERAMGRLSEARRDVEVALRILESLRLNIADPELRATYFQTAERSYKFYIDLLMQMHSRSPKEGFDALALQASEAFRARSLMDMLARARVDVRQGVDQALLQRQLDLQERLGVQEERQVRLLARSRPSAKTEDVAKRLRELTREEEEVDTEIRRTSPQYAALTQPRPLNLEQIQALVLDAHSVLLEYSLGEERSYLWALSPNTIASFQLPGRKEIEGAARRFYNLLTARNAYPTGETARQRTLRLEQAEKDCPEAAARLGRMVLAPAANLLDNKRLLIAAEGGLEFIPFGALPDPAPVEGAGKSFIPMLARHEVVSLPSASVIAVLRSEMRERKQAPKGVAVLADPVFDLDDERIAGRPRLAESKDGDSTSNLPGLNRAMTEVGLLQEGARIPRLPFSRREAEAIAALLPGDDVLEALDFQASRETAISPRLNQYRIVHFATHTLINVTEPELSGTILSLLDPQGRLQNGFLRMHEIYNLRLAADLVVLSACQTALGKEIHGEGIIGLARGFMYAGTPRVVASLWEVNDAATSELMAKFYRAMLKEHVRPADALRAAQMQLWRQKRWHNPYFWAAFVLQGEWN